LVLGHRGKLRKLEAASTTTFVAQLLCLRLAVIKCHARRDPDTERAALCARRPRLSLQLRADWAAAYPQSAHLLREEAQAWQKTACWRMLTVNGG
jgi:exopolyphosphatase/guanosine-5'-triphosphate,3'-diphosphate pyrophosphatase